MEEASDDEMEEPEEPKVEEEEEEEDEIVESDVELEGDTVEPDNDPPQKVKLPNKASAFWFTNFTQIMSLDSLCFRYRWVTHRWK